jgi:hypothetical protein
VTTFTLSDFGRTFSPASGRGTDHAWGNHHFIMAARCAAGRCTALSHARAGRPGRRGHLGALDPHDVRRAVRRHPRALVRAERWRARAGLPEPRALRACQPGVRRLRLEELPGTGRSDFSR